MPARPSTTRTRFSSRSPARRSPMRKGLPRAPARVRSRSPPAGAPSTSFAISATAVAASGVSEIVVAPAAVSSASARRTGAAPWSGRTAISHATGSDASHCVSIRKAKPHPASAHWTSSRHTTSGCRSAARSISVWISASSQNGSSRERSREPSEVRSMSGSVPPNSASISTEPWPGSAVPRPVLNSSARAVSRAAASSLVLPRPASPSMITTPPVPAPTRCRKPASISRCSSRPRIGDELKGLPLLRFKELRQPPPTNIFVA